MGLFDLSLNRINRRVAVVGTYRAGKTVLLTSLLNHLEYQKPGTFSIGPDGKAELQRVKIHEEAEPGTERFAYERFRNALVNDASWPNKTSDRSSISVSMEPSHWNYRKLKLTFFDFPGERVADAAMASRPRYEDWADDTIKRLQNESEYRHLVEPWLEMVEAGSGDQAQLIETYKLAMASLILGYKPLVSPSVFLLDEEGKPARGKTPADVAEGRRLGTRKSGDLIPLSAKQRDTHPALLETMRKRYNIYRDQIVLPLYRDLASCQRLLVLCDITTLLAGGSGMFNDNVALLEHLFQELRGRSGVSSLLGPLADALDIRIRGFEKLAFAATKIDLVAPLDRGRCVDLLQQMTHRWQRDSHGECKTFGVSGIASTQPVPHGGERELLARPMLNADGQRLPADGPHSVVEVPELPETWPAAWEPEKLVFPMVHPEVPHVRMQAPVHIGLDQLFEFIAL